MKYLVIIAGILLGLLFIAASATYLLHLVPMPALPEGSPQAAFMAAFIPTGYMTFVKVMELLGGLLVMVPMTRRAGLLILGPVVINIIAYHFFVMKGEGLTEPPMLILLALVLFLLWVERKAFWALVCPG